MGTNSRDCSDHFKYSNLKINEVDGSTDLDFALKKKARLAVQLFILDIYLGPKALECEAQSFLIRFPLCPLTDFECLQVL